MAEARAESAMRTNGVGYRIAKWIPLTLSIAAGCFNHVAASQGAIVLDSAAVGAALGGLSLLIAGYELLFRRPIDIEKRTFYSRYAVLLILSMAAVHWNGISMRAGMTQYENLRRQMSTPASRPAWRGGK